MNYKLSLNTLNEYGPIFFDGYKWLVLARKLAKAEGTKLDSEWLNYKKSEKKIFNDPDIDKETSYDECVQCKIYFDEGLKFEVTVKEGDMVDGRPLESRCKFKLVLPSCPVEFDDMLQKRLEVAALNRIRQEDEAAFSKRVEQALKVIVNELSRG